MKNLFCLLCFLTLLLPVCAMEPDAEVGCAVLDLDNQADLKPGEIKTLSANFRTLWSGLSPEKPMSFEKMNEILAQKKFNIECAGTQCALEAGDLLGVRFVVYGTVGRVGQLYSISLYKADVATAAIVKSITQTIRGEAEDLLSYGIESAARKLAGLSGSGGSAAPGTATSTPAWQGGTDLGDLMSRVREKEVEAKQLEEARLAAERQLAAELARRKAQFEKEYADYQSIVTSPHADADLKRTAWRRITEAWAVKNAGPEPGSLSWGANGLLQVGAALRAASAGAPGRTRTLDLGGGVMLEMVWIPAGSFTMGSPENEAGRSREEGPQQQVRISEGF